MSYNYNENLKLNWYKGLLISFPRLSRMELYLNKFSEIEDSLDKGEKRFTPVDLALLSAAYESLRNLVEETEHKDVEETPAQFNEWLQEKHDIYQSIFEGTALKPSAPSWEASLELFGEIASKIKLIYSNNQRKNNILSRRPISTQE